jgi:hypothetical protein
MRRCQSTTPRRFPIDCGVLWWPQSRRPLAPFLCEAAQFAAIVRELSSNSGELDQKGTVLIAMDERPPKGFIPPRTACAPLGGQKRYQYAVSNIYRILPAWSRSFPAVRRTE